MSKRKDSEAKAWKTAEERSKEKCTWLTKEERDENLAALKRMEDLMLCLNIKPDPEEPKQIKHPKNGGNKKKSKNNKTKNKK